MPKRKYKTCPKALLEQGRLIVKSNNDTRYIHRVEMVNLVLAGMVPSEVSKYCRESTNTITGWVKIVDEQGFEALRIKKYPGRAPKLNAQQLEEIKQTILEDRPEDHGYYVWDGPSLSDYIKKKHDITYTVRHCQRLLRSLGFSLVRPQPYPSKGEENEVAREDFKKNSRASRGPLRQAVLPGRGAFSASDKHYEKVGGERLVSPNQIASR